MRIPKPISGGRRAFSRLTALILIATVALSSVFVAVAWHLLAGKRDGQHANAAHEMPVKKSRSAFHGPKQESPELGTADLARAGTSESTLPSIPGSSDSRFIEPLADSYRRIDPAEDGWRTEAFSEAASGQLARLAHLLENTNEVSADGIESLASAGFHGKSLRPTEMVTVFDDRVLAVSRERPDAAVPADVDGVAGLVEAFRELTSPLRDASDVHVKFKLFQVEPEANAFTTTAYFLASGVTSSGAIQINATWKCRWSDVDSPSPLLQSIEVEDYEEVRHQGSSGKLFSDCTEAVLGKNDSYHRQLAHGTDHWRRRLARDLGLDVVANHGLALGDVNGDRLEDLYVCQQGGLPNRLFLRNPDGTLTDASAQSGADWLDYCASALLVDFDNDGDADLVVAQEWRVLFMSNDGQGKFQLEFGLGTHAQSFSMAAADYDQDGDLDVYLCGYNPSASSVRLGIMGEPMPYHDANNGGRNMLLRNEGNWEFIDVTEQVGLDENNTRHSFAVAWEDYDNDGDQDLYVANDYGRNNLYRNDGGRFRDVAPELDVEDQSAGMSVSWGDYNQDGWMDLYVSNMFSSAGNRITYQRQFKSEVNETIRSQFQRHARGNTLFESTGDGRFRDVSEPAGVTMGRWAWGSKFVDLNNDSLEDLMVANGFITTDDPDDL